MVRLPSLRHTFERNTRPCLGLMETSNNNSDLETGTRRQQTIHESLRKAVISKVAGQGFRDTLLGWLADANIPFTGIEHPLFRQLLCLLNRELVQELLPASGDTVKAWMRIA